MCVLSIKFNSNLSTMQNVEDRALLKGVPERVGNSD